ncbi:MAG: carboxypeptidase regulatory-like domain-containing protein [Deltaproteobacteria bacterium]|nr:carboxypeptidase regulatory-like domain-containing protein [Deltaproteobacteria bacterium]
MRALTLALALLTAAAAVASPPVVKVRGRARVHLEPVTPRPEGVLVAGQVIDARLRSGIPHRAVTVAVSRRGRTERHVLHADAHGRFRTYLQLPQGRFTIRVLADEDDRYGAAQPAEARLDLTAPIPRRWLLLPFAVTAVLLLGAAATRLRPWRRRARPAAAPPPDRRLTTGLRAPRQGPFGALRARDDVSFGGRVFDVYAEEPVAGATVEVIVRDRPIETPLYATTDAAGRFAVPALMVGHHEVLVRAPGFVTERFLIAVPHRGELRGVRIDVVPVRVRVIEIYRDAVLGLLPDADRLWVWTPREVLVHAPGARSDEAAPLPSLTRLVEETYYSGRPRDEAVIDEARRLAIDVAPVARV